MKKLFCLLILLGAILLIGTARASDNGTIDGSQIWLQVSIAACLIGIGYIGNEVTDKAKRPQHSQCRKRIKKNINKVILAPILLFVKRYIYEQ